ncbi:uncharacterized protein METZ01_LOCUS307555 [marine metagenome]|uniref:Phosphoribulokinase/uridine kinase domain-containing protein n=1 Tax=marine metagenome TaxID=408172 RepID=A0A382N568_9ZZZZ
MSKNLAESIQQQLLKITNIKFSLQYIKKNIYPIFEYINDSKKKKFLISGSQGIGKSTLSIILEKNFKIFYKKKVLCLSLDNYYLTKKERIDLSETIHPLLLTRGVPGTHDIQKLLTDIKNFNKSKYPIYTPIFNKLTDDRTKRTKELSSDVDILILEGWCCGCPPLSDKFLSTNINTLEKEKDMQQIWRNYFNKQLKEKYSTLFGYFDKLIYLKPPSFSLIINWRLKQEKMMIKNKKNKLMNKKEILEFIAHYEKVTKWMMKILPFHSDLCIIIDKNQKIIKLKYKL